MTHCVFDALLDHLHYLNIAPLNRDWLSYRRIKYATQDFETYTYGGVVPLIAARIAQHHNLQLAVRCAILDKKCYLDESRSNRRYMQTAAVMLGNFGKFVDTITLAPAVYCSFSRRHAFFSLTLPSDQIILMAIRFQQRS